MQKSTIVIYWVDTKTPLTYLERKHVLDTAEVVSMTPQEVLLVDLRSNRKISVRGVTDLSAPVIPEPKARA